MAESKPSFLGASPSAGKAADLIENPGGNPSGPKATDPMDVQLPQRSGTPDTNPKDAAKGGRLPFDDLARSTKVSQGDVTTSRPFRVTKKA